MSAPITTYPTSYADVALALVGNGYAPVPLDPATKVPNRKGWQHRVLMTPDELRLEVMRELSWRGDADRRHCACGIVVPTYLLAVDCDLTDPDANATARRILHAELGVPRMGRIGNPPKFMAIYGASQPVLSRKLGGVELFCGSGQIAAFGIHAKTRQPYLWSPVNPLSTSPAQLPQVSAAQVDAFVRALGAANVLHPRQREVVRTPHRDGGLSQVAPRGSYPATERLRQLFSEHGGLVKPAVRQLIAETGRAGHDRHDTIVPIAGVLVRRGWLNRAITEFLTPLVNGSFGDGDWTIEVERAVAHARNRVATRQTARRRRHQQQHRG
jgi:hypothetical protein